jgi:hypothetical protein
MIRMLNQMQVHIPTTGPLPRIRAPNPRLTRTLHIKFTPTPALTIIAHQLRIIQAMVINPRARHVNIGFPGSERCGRDMSGRRADANRYRYTYY